MTIRSLICISLILTGCATFKELAPRPEINSREGKFNELKNKNENFILKKNEQFLLRFPKPDKDDYYLLLAGKNKSKIHSYLTGYFNPELESILTTAFHDTDGTMPIFTDQAEQNDSLAIFSIDSSTSCYTWVIDTVREDVEIHVQYRYVQQWRYKYEIERERIDSLWKISIQNRSMYDKFALGTYDDAFNCTDVIKSYKASSEYIQKIQVCTDTLATIFPPEVKTSNDKTYIEFLDFQKKVNDELLFQKNILATATVLKLEKESRGNISAFFHESPTFVKYFSDVKQAPSPVIENVKSKLSTRLDEILPLIETELKKSDPGSGESFAELANAEKLFAVCEKPVPDDLRKLIPFLKKFSEEWQSMRDVETIFAAIDAEVAGLNERPTLAFYKQILSLLGDAKNNLPESEARRMEKFGKYKCAIVLDQRITNAGVFIDGLKEQVQSLRVFEQQTQIISTMLGSVSGWPSDNFYNDVLVHVDEIRNSFPKTTPEYVVPYSDSKSAIWASDRLKNAIKQENDFRQRYQRAGEIVRQINQCRAQGNFHGIVRLLSQNRSLGFLEDQYGNVDTLSLGLQTRAIAAAISSGSWKIAEGKIDDLYHDKDYINYEAISEKKNRMVKYYEQQLYLYVDSASVRAAESFIQTHELSVKNVIGSYKDSSFLPVYRLQFSSTGAADLQKKQSHIAAELSELKYVRYPEAAIKAQYRELMKNILDQGVERARAIADHGKYYRGNDKQVRTMVMECDYTIAKPFTKSGEYRRFFLLPVTNNKKETNEYVLRLVVNIPSEAQFPIYDFNITVPKEIAQNTNQSWFSEISINKKQIKNEGRYHITAPTSSNNYESQITPVQIEKGGANIFEIKLRYAGLRVFEMSVMAQKPIIRKN